MIRNSFLLAFCLILTVFLNNSFAQIQELTIPSERHVMFVSEKNHGRCFDVRIDNIRRALSGNFYFFMESFSEEHDNHWHHLHWFLENMFLMGSLDIEAVQSNIVSFEDEHVSVLSQLAVNASVVFDYLNQLKLRTPESQDIVIPSQDFSNLNNQIKELRFKLESNIYAMQAAYGVFKEKYTFASDDPYEAMTMLKVFKSRTIARKEVEKTLDLMLLLAMNVPDKMHELILENVGESWGASYTIPDSINQEAKEYALAINRQDPYAQDRKINFPDLHNLSLQGNEQIYKYRTYLTNVFIKKILPERIKKVMSSDIVKPIVIFSGYYHQEAIIDVLAQAKQNQDIDDYTLLTCN